MEPKASVVDTSDTAELGLESQPQPAILAINLTKQFGQRLSVDCLNLSVYPGELYALLGENGAGKTTTINMLTTLLQPTAGRFYLCGIDGTRDADRTRGIVGVVSQDIALYKELTAYENLQFTADLYGISRAVARQRIVSMLDEMRLVDRAHDRVDDFSGGMQRKLSIAMAMVHNPRVLFMDEPTVGLDAASRRQIWEHLDSLRSSGVTIFLTTHYLEEAELLANRIGIIRAGKLVVEGTISELRGRVRDLRTVVVTLTKRIAADRIGLITDYLKEHGSGPVSYDRLRNELIFEHDKAIPIGSYLRKLIAMLERQSLEFEAIAPCQLSLEDIFLGMKAHRATPGEM